MKAHHAVALALIGWTLFIEEPKYCPKRNINCVFEDSRDKYIKRGIPTEDTCKKAMNQWWFKFDKMLRDTNNVVVTKAKPSQCVPDNKADQQW